MEAAIIRLTRPFLVLLTLTAAALPLSASLVPDAPSSEPVGMNALMEVQNFAMTYPGRFGDAVQMHLARDYLVERLEGHGLEVIEHRYHRGTNIIGLVRGTERPHDWVTVSAHYDTVMTPFSGTGATVSGAWDDGSGVAAALELARVSAMKEWNNTVAFVFFDDEERGLVGSRYFVGEWDGKAWEGGNVRLTANLNMDPPGLHWPCIADGAVLPLAYYQAHAWGEGQALLREIMLDAKDAVGVPEDAFDLYTGGVNVGILRGRSDNANFGEAGIPEMYLGSSTHLFLAENRLYTMYPLHTPADTLQSMIAYCGGNPLTLADAFQVALDIEWIALHAIDAYPGPFPRP